MYTRRQFLTSAAAGLAGAAAAGTASADHPDSQPSDVSLAFDEQYLKDYRPLLVIRHLDVRPQGLYGWVATSAEHETDTLVYSAAYTHQNSGAEPLGIAAPDAHFGDHEWFYVFVDSDTGDVQEVVFSAYHWLAGRATSGSIPFYEDTHPKAHVVSPWHQFTLTQDEGVFVELDDLTEAFEHWLANGMEKDLQPGTVADPWRMKGADGRAHWWKNTAAGVSTDAVYARLLYHAGLFGADQAEVK